MGLRCSCGPRQPSYTAHEPPRQSLQDAKAPAQNLLAATVLCFAMLLLQEHVNSETSETGLAMATGFKTPPTLVAVMLLGTQRSPKT